MAVLAVVVALLAGGSSGDVEQALDEARPLRRAGELGRAIDVLDEALRSHPGQDQLTGLLVKGGFLLVKSVQIGLHVFQFIFQLDSLLFELFQADR